MRCSPFPLLLPPSITPLLSLSLTRYTPPSIQPSTAVRAWTQPQWPLNTCRHVKPATRLMTLEDSCTVQWMFRISLCNLTHTCIRIYVHVYMYTFIHVCTDFVGVYMYVWYYMYVYILHSVCVLHNKHKGQQRYICSTHILTCNSIIYMYMYIRIYYIGVAELTGMQTS